MRRRMSKTMMGAVELMTQAGHLELGIFPQPTKISFSSKRSTPKMKLEEFAMARNGATFFSRLVADSIPFQETFLGILKIFSLKPESKEAKVMKRTIANCKRPAIEGEDKYCATSLESFVDFSVSKFGEKHSNIVKRGGNKNGKPRVYNC
ncbi:hypothetical protein CRYUN_Cryun11dG0082500 [Craigia yunnanensis]